MLKKTMLATLALLVLAAAPAFARTMGRGKASRLRA